MLQLIVSFLKKYLKSNKGVSEVIGEALLIAASISLFMVAILSPVTQITNWLSQLWGGISEKLAQGESGISSGLNWVLNILKEMFGLS